MKEREKKKKGILVSLHHVHLEEDTTPAAHTRFCCCSKILCRVTCHKWYCR